MPFRETYQINNREQGKAAVRDQSFRSCITALLIFFIMCLILLACIPLKMQKEYKDRHIEHEPQHHHQERIKEETTMTVPLTTQRTPTTERIVLSRTQTTPKTVITSTTITENRPTTEDTNVVTKDYMKKNVKGSRHFERFFENKTSVDEITISSVPVSQEETEDYATKEILKNIETTEESIGLATLPHDMTNNVIDNNAASTSPSGPIMSTTTLKYVTIVDIINAPENSTKKYERLRIGVDNISTTPSLLTDIAESTSENSQFEATTSDVITSIRSDSESSTTMKDLNYEESAATEYNATLINETITRERAPATINYTPLIDEKFSTTTKVKSEAEDMMNETTTNAMSYITEKYNENVTSDKIKKYSVSSTSTNATTTFDFYNHTTSTVVPISYNDTNLTTTARTTLSDEYASVCETGHCKQIVSRMMSYMNHSADPCDDFYEYACGGFEANPQLIDGDLVRRSRNYQRIARQMLKEKRENVHSTFATYYDSCVEYERNMNFSERTRMGKLKLKYLISSQTLNKDLRECKDNKIIKNRYYRSLINFVTASDALRKIGEFYIPTTWPDYYISDNYTGFTNLFAQLMLHHSALLFDVVPELDEYRPNSFTLKISPTMYESSFTEEYMEDPCFEDKLETKGHYVDLEILYNNYNRCKNDTSEFIRSIRKALTELNVFKGLNDSYLEWNVQSEYIEKTIHVIDSIIMKEYFSSFPSKSEIREAYVMNNYSKISLKELQSSSTFVSEIAENFSNFSVNWTQLIRSLTGMNVVTSENIQVYFHAALIKGLRRLEEYAKEDSVGLNNAIMGLYAHRLYRELILPKRDNVKDHCLHMATYLLKLEASSLYISSFTDHEIVQMNSMIEKTFNELKQTLSIKMQEAQWAKEEGREELLKKINSLKLLLPVVSYFKNRDLLIYSEYNASEIIRYNYFNNSMILLKRYRALMYAELRRQISDPQQIWTYYVTPFQSKARVIYTQNLVVIPYGIIDWSLINNELFFDYLLMATLGNLIAHQIAHHFDTNGVHYWNQTRNTQDSLMFENEFTNTHFDDYVNCQKENLYQGPMTMTLPFTDQPVSFKIPRLTLNERLSEIMGLRLAYDTLALTRSDAKRLPWIRLRIDQLFYLAYAQTYCTKMPLTSSYVSLYESEDLPNRIRVFVSASNNKFLADAWNCPLGSQIAPNDICSVFPYIGTKETVMMPE